MKKIFLLLMLPVLFCGFKTFDVTGITDEERGFAVKHLKQTSDDLIKTVEGLTDAQLNFKPAPDRWSVLECVQHITLSSQGLWHMTDSVIHQPKDDTLKSSVQDEQFIKMVEDRSFKAQAPEMFKPIKSPYHTLRGTLTAFKADRAKLIDYVSNTTDDLRGHFAKLPFATIDTYQFILMISAHTNRHTQQLNEVKADPNFPK